MKKNLPINIFLGIFILGIPLCLADDSSPDARLSHLQIVNQELDRIEYGTNVQAPAVVTVSENNIAHPSTVSYRRLEFGFGEELYWAKFREPGNYNQKGFLTGYNTRLTYRTPPGSKSLINMYRLEGQWAKGKFNNQTVGALSDVDGIKDTSYEIRALAGKDLYPTSYLRLTGYSGLGYRFLKDNPAGLSTSFVDPLGGTFSAPSFQSTSHYFYLPFGTDIRYQTNPRYSIDSNFEFDDMVRGWEKEKLGVLQSSYGNTVNGQKKGYGLRASLRLNRYYKYFDAYAEIFFRYWNIAQSENVPDPTDPTNPPLNVLKNSTEEFGLRLGLEI